MRHSGRVEEEMESERSSSQVWHSHHLQQGQVSSAHIVKVDLDILPPDLGKVLVNECFALCPVVNHIHGKVLLRRLIEAVAVLARKQVDAHDTENQPKDEANQQHIHNGRDGTHQGVDYHLDQTKGERKIQQSEDQEVERITAHSKPKTLHTVMALHLNVFFFFSFFGFSPPKGGFQDCSFLAYHTVKIIISTVQCTWYEGAGGGEMCISPHPLIGAPLRRLGPSLIWKRIRLQMQKGIQTQMHMRTRTHLKVSCVLISMTQSQHVVI